PDGYIKKEALPNSVTIVPEAPLPGSPRQKLDDAIAKEAVKLNRTARFELAARDATMHFPEAPNSFACAMGKMVSKEKTPRLYRLLKRSGVDAGYATRKAKHAYNRMRPFTLNNAPICTPQWEKELRHNGSYPSGHTSLGWAWALILSELLPEKADAVLARGVAYGESRIICNVHWYSDVVAGRMMGASAFALMHDNPEFIADMKAAKAELAAAPAPDAKMCQEEIEALSFKLD
ncbi:MAG: phosphatase, partial [Epsilonproteobacteria bacterium 4484_20]